MKRQARRFQLQNPLRHASVRRSAVGWLTLVPYLCATLYPATASAQTERQAQSADLHWQESSPSQEQASAIAPSLQNGSETSAQLQPQTRQPAMAEGLTQAFGNIDPRANALKPGESLEKTPQLDFDAINQLQALPTGSAPIAAQAISLPSGAATVSGMGESFSAQLTTGIATFNVPFSYPAARGIAQPTLSLVYSSSAGYGDAGVGWSAAGQVVIARQTDRGTPLYDDRDDWHPNQDRFNFGAQELVPICTVTGGFCEGALADEVLPPWSEGWQYFRARVEAAFMRFFWAPNHRTWRIQTKLGAQFELGEPLDGSGYQGGIEANPTRPKEIFRWHAVRQYDSHGQPDALPMPLPTNVVMYRYIDSGSIKVLSDVFYTPPAANPLDGNLSHYAHHLALKWEERPDKVVSYRAGFLQEQRLRLTGVDVSSKPFTAPEASPRELVRRYHLSYNPLTHASLLESMATEGRCLEPFSELADGSLPATNCERLPGMLLGYQRVSASGAPLVDAQGLEFEPFNETIVDLGDRSPPHSLDETRTALMDINSDALPDLLVTAPALFNGKHGLFLNGAGGATGFGKNIGMSVTGVPNVDASVLSFTNNNISPLDVDADGTINLLHMPLVKRYSIFTPKKAGSDWTWEGREIPTASGQDVKINFEQDAARVARVDVNGDGLVDFVFSSATELQTFFALGRLPGGDTQYGNGAWTGADTAEIHNDPVTTCVPWSASGVQFDDPDVRFAEMNGDGLPDIVRLRSGQVLYWPGRGNGFWGTGERDDCNAGSFGQDRHLQMENAPSFGTTAPGGLQLADVNGDGLADLVEFRVDAVDVYLNDNGRGWTDRYVLDDVPIKPNGSNYVQLTDIDGSGTPDLLWGRAYEYRYIDLTGGVQPYLLTSVENGLGKRTELEYESSTKLMLAAQSAGSPWTSTIPLSTPVVVRSIVRDRLQVVGREAGTYVTEYSYRDPVFEGRQREFRGFSSADVRTLGDANSPTSTVRSTFLLGECRPLSGQANACLPAERWRDNWREALSGLPVLVEAFDEEGTYLSTEHTRYELRQLYTGRDGRRVSVPNQVGGEGFAYDTSSFDGAATTVELPEVDIFVDDVEESETRSVTRRATSGTARLRSRRTFDNYGNALESQAEGCVEGCLAADEVITEHTDHERPIGDESGWLFRPSSTFVTGSVTTEPRQQKRSEYDAAGDLVRTYATLSGTLPLDRFHENPSAEVAPPPVNASGGVTDPVEIQAVAYTRDAFGNVTGQRKPLGGCSTTSFDTAYAELPVGETTFGGALDVSTGCGEHAFVIQADYDRGWSQVVSATSVNGQPTRFDYDGFGRLIAQTFADPENPGFLAEYAASTFEYLLPVDATVTPFSVVVTRTQDGESPSDPSYHESYAYADGLGRTLVQLSEADPFAGDGGEFVASGVRHYDGKGQTLRAYEPYFVTVDPLAFSLGTVPPMPFSSASYDAFGRTVFAFGLDGEPKLFNDYHAMSQDVWDAADLALGPHTGTFATSIADGHGRPIETIQRVKVGATLEVWRETRQYLPSGELLSITQHRAGSPNVARWLRYDSLGRLVLNAEPNTSQGFDPDPETDPDTIKAWRYAYDDSGNLVGTSDARGCGVNSFFDTAGRMTAQDYSPCQNGQEPYSDPDFGTGFGVEVSNHFDTPDASLGVVVDDAGLAFTFNASLYWGRTVSTADRGSRGVVRYDALGRVTGGAIQVAKPGPAAIDPSTRYAARWYISEATYDAAHRPLESTTGVTTAELLGAGGRSSVTSSYSARGQLTSVDSSYGTLLASATFAADGKLLGAVLGDAAATERAYSYDQLRRLHSVQLFRGEPELWSTPPYPPSSELTQQLLLEDIDFSYDPVNNVTQITDYRIASDWPGGAKPVTRKFEYDDAYRLTRTIYEYPGGSDSWTSPFAAENAGTSLRPAPSPNVEFDERVKEQRYQYDHLGNLGQTTDDQSGFFDRSLGDQEHGGTNLGPHQLVSASNRTLAPMSDRRGDLETRYDGAGNLTDLVVRREGPCLPTGASCWQRFAYSWDELGRIVQAQRWDLTGGEQSANDAPSEPPPARSADVELRYIYDSSGKRVIKTAEDALGSEVHTVYISGGYQLRRTTYAGSDYSLTRDIVNVYVAGGGVRGRVVYSEEDLPSLSSGNRRLFLELPDYLGSTGILVDHETGELVEYTTYEPYGATESDYRPERWGQFREEYKFTGKEEDIEVGLQYFGARYLVVALNRWASPDPVTIHGLQGDPNPYAYVKGRPTVMVDPNGQVALGIVALGAAVGALVGATVYIMANGLNSDYGGLFAAMGMGALAGGLLTFGVGSGLTGVGSANLFAGTYGTLSFGGFAAVAATGAGAGVAIGTGVAILDGRDAGGIVALGLETGLTTGIGATLGYATGWLAGGGLSWLGWSGYPMAAGLAAGGAISGGINGAFTGAREVYNWENGTGFAAFAADSTWGLMGTTQGNFVNIANTFVGDAEYSEELSRGEDGRGRNRQVYMRGFRIRPQSAFTWGNTTSNLSTNQEGEPSDELVSHEDQHIFTNRVAGPVYPTTYAFFLVLGGVIALGGLGISGLWGQSPGESLEGWAYYSNPWEGLAYCTNNPRDERHPGINYCP